MELSLVEQHHVVFPVLALFNTWANKSQGDSEYWRKVSSGKLHQGQGSLTLSGGTKNAHLVACCVWLPEATIYFHKSLGLVSLAGIVMHYMENGGLGNGTFISWAWLGSTRISRQVLSRWSWRQGRRMTKLCRSTTPPRVLRRAEHEACVRRAKTTMVGLGRGELVDAGGPLVARVQRLWPRLQIRYFGSAWSPESSVCSAAAAGLPLIHLIIPSYIRGGEVGLCNNIRHFLETDSQFVPSIFFFVL